MANNYVRPLNVSSPDGKRIIAHIISTGDNKRIIEVAFLEEVKKDDPPFACNGQIRFSCKREKYVETIKILEKYLEDIFLKGMADENIYSSLGTKSKRRGVKKQNIETEIIINKRKRNSPGLHYSTGRKKSTKSIATGDADIEVAEDNNSESC